MKTAPIHESTCGQAKTYEFEATRFIGKSLSYEEHFEMSCILWELMIERARLDLFSDNPSLRCDAYFWLVSSRSDLYTRLAPLYGLKINPSFFREDVLAAGLPDFPDRGVPCLLVDTSDPQCWAYSPEGEPIPTYLARLADELMSEHRADEIESAVCCGLELLCIGRRGPVALAAIKKLLSCMTKNLHSKTTRRAILDLYMSDNLLMAA